MGTAIGLLLAAAGLTAVAVVLRRRGAGRRSARREAMARFRELLARRHPRVQVVGMVPGRLAAVLRVAGQETPVPLGEVLRRIEAFPDAADAVVDQLVQEIEAFGLERPDDHPFAEVALEVMPQIRTGEWVERQGRFGPGGLVSRPLGAGLHVTYVIDGPQCMTFVCRAHLREWHRSADEVHELALSNLRRHSRDLAVPRPGASLLSRRGDGYDAARLLLLDPEQAEGLLVAVPDRDLLWVGPPDDEGLAGLMAATSALGQETQHPLTEELLEMRDGRLRVVRS